MADPAPVAADTIALPDLSVLRARVTYRLLESTTLPPYKGALLRGGFGYAFQRAACPSACWGRSDQCKAGMICPYRWVFETPRPPGAGRLHDLQDVPRPFVIEPPLDHKRAYAAGDALEFGLTLIGRGIDYLPYFFVGFAELGQAGLGRDHAKAKLERVEALEPFRPIGRPIYQDGRPLDTGDLPTLSVAELTARAAALPADLRLTLRTPLRVKSRGAFIAQLDLPAIVQAACWRLAALAAFHGEPWEADYRPLVAAAREVIVERPDVQWVDWERTSTREAQPRQMTLGGIIGTATLRGAPPAVRAALLTGSLLHIGKAAVFGHGWVELAHV
ncbi:CRISPR system precrRNA processing endoribonuclease RAMP protein Cas6 [Oscillochloris sp. ZM17-4]|uniref:CRISPR system precrRNA processing endoribonuclease RAMP protein Cas6 n=1 Tax=Oscillochloris sp. ZM17-4 TaxID=2866714 RepID=UPI001C72EE46|nr:CRISPR system precrRNA processing endoribonuclease RAMP protein Cas6 [Oscillochloris sp. ZM17-4]MBX0331283.1 CRISPR system precrRNA processing endoribonuclease RAMP protein Cas6 [Oscillochloris sp. ZM17-4]